MSDKTGITDFGRGLYELGFDLISSGGTAAHLAAAGVPVKDVAELIGDKPFLNDRVKTLSREVAGGLLATLSKKDRAELKKRSIRRIDLVCVNPYHLQKEIENPGSTFESVIKNTDVGGPTMLHSGAKGQRIVVSDPADYGRVLEWLRAGMPDEGTFIQALMAKAELTVVRHIFDSARYHGKGTYEGMFGELVRVLRYGENPHQPYAAVFRNPDAEENPFAPDKFKLVGGGSPSYINMTDLDRLLTTAIRIEAGLERNWQALPIALAVKHGNLCGIGVDESPVRALQKMVQSDPTSLSGGCVLVNFQVNFACADFMRTGGPRGTRMPDSRVVDEVVAPSFTPDAKERLNRANGKCRMFENAALGDLGEKYLSRARRFRQIEGGFLVQDPDVFVLKIPDEWKKTLTLKQQRDLVIAAGIGATSNSNTVVLVYDGCLLGRGIAQPSRVLACKVALLHAKENGHTRVVPLAVAYSDSFFPFDDGPTALAKAKVKIVFATSGSVKDAEVQKTCKRLGVKLLQLPDKEARGFHGH